MILRLAKMDPATGELEVSEVSIRDFEKGKEYRGVLELNYLESAYPGAVFEPLENAVLVIKEEIVEVKAPFEELKKTYLSSGVLPLIRALVLFDPEEDVKFTLDFNDEFTFTAFEGEKV